MSLNKIISNKVAADILAERLIGSSINKITYAITEWSLRILGPSCPEYTLRAAIIELANIGLWRKSEVRLETNQTLGEAIKLYRSAGYCEVPAFNEEPFAHHWFEKHF